MAVTKDIGHGQWGSSDFYFHAMTFYSYQDIGRQAYPGNFHSEVFAVQQMQMLDLGLSLA